MQKQETNQEKNDSKQVSYHTGPSQEITPAPVYHKSQGQKNHQATAGIFLSVVYTGAAAPQYPTATASSVYQGNIAVLIVGS